MSDKKSNNYDVYLAKIDKTDKNGNDITNDKLGKGGRHRKDGTYSSVAYDFEKYDIEQALQDKEELNQLRAEKEQHEWDNLSVCDNSYYEEDNFEPYNTAQLVCESLDAIANITTGVAQFLQENPEIVQRIKQGWNRITNFFKGASTSCVPSTQSGVIEHRQNELCQSLYELNSNESFENRSNISLEEARKAVIELIASYIKFRSSYNLLKNSNIDGIQSPFEKLSFNEVIDSLEAKIDEFPGLLNQETTEKINVLLMANCNENENQQISKVLGIKEPSI